MAALELTPAQRERIAENRKEALRRRRECLDKQKKILEKQETILENIENNNGTIPFCSFDPLTKSSNPGLSGTGNCLIIINEDSDKENEVVTIKFQKSIKSNPSQELNLKPLNFSENSNFVGNFFDSYVTDNDHFFLSEKDKKKLSEKDQILLSNDPKKVTLFKNGCSVLETKLKSFQRENSEKSEENFEIINQEIIFTRQNSFSIVDENVKFRNLEQKLLENRFSLEKNHDLGNFCGTREFTLGAIKVGEGNTTTETETDFVEKYCFMSSLSSKKGEGRKRERERKEGGGRGNLTIDPNVTNEERGGDIYEKRGLIPDSTNEGTGEVHGKRGLLWPPRQKFDYFVVVDFESTCDNAKTLYPQEIIEFPSVLVNARSMEIEDRWRVYVRPEVNFCLTSFCKRLTGIQQSQVDAGASLREALSLHATWLRERGILNKNFAIVTWSDWDCKIMLETETKWKKIQKPPYFNQWINLKIAFEEAKLKREKKGLKGAVEAAGIKWKGRAHSGLDDSLNTAKLLISLIYRGAVMEITNSFKIYGPDGTKLDRSVVLQNKQKKSDFEGGKNRSGKAGEKRGFESGKGQKRKGFFGHFCECGVKSKRRTVKKPGNGFGKAFYSCGKWTITEGGECNFFIWESS